jgi:hypothetical protein
MKDVLEKPKKIKYQIKFRTHNQLELELIYDK